MPKEWMIDCETLALDSHAAVWQIALVNCADHTEAKQWETQPSEILHLVNNGKMLTDQSTLSWAYKTYGTASAFARWHHAYLHDEHLETATSITKIHDEIDTKIKNGDIVWAKGADSDFPILENMFKVSQYNHKAPWYYRDKSCMRTLVNECKRAGMDKRTLDSMQTGTKHEAIHDCWQQIKMLHNLRTYLGLR